MRKHFELSVASSCTNRARDTEWMFVLLGRDAAAPGTIRFWAQRRIELGENTPQDEQIREALECAAAMENEREAKKGNVSHV